MSLVIYIYISMIMGGRVDDPRLPWRELTYPTKREKEHHLQECLGKRAWLVSRRVPIPKVFFRSLIPAAALIALSASLEASELKLHINGLSAVPLIR